MREKAAGARSLLFRLDPTLGISGDIPPHSIYDFMEWTGTILCTSCHILKVK